jgi:hypothetical protein
VVRRPLTAQVGAARVGSQVAQPATVRTHVGHHVKGELFQQRLDRFVYCMYNLITFITNREAEEAMQEAFHKVLGHAFARVLTMVHPANGRSRANNDTLKFAAL